MQRNEGQHKTKKTKASNAVVRSAPPGTLGGFIMRTQRALITIPWQVIQIAPTNAPGEFKLWALVSLSCLKLNLIYSFGFVLQVGSELHMIKLTVPRMFYANLRKPKTVDEGALFKKCNRTLPRSRPVHNLYLYNVPEADFQEHGK